MSELRAGILTAVSTLMQGLHMGDRWASLFWVVVSLMFATTCLGGGHGGGVSKSKTNKGYVLIHAGTLLAVPGTAPEFGKTVVIRGKHIVDIRDGFIGPEAIRPDDGEPVQIIDLKEYFVLPGLMDAHTHLGWSSGDLPPKKLDTLSKEDLTLWTLRSARTVLAAGFTTVRDLASEPYVMFAVRDWINGDKYLGPRILAAGLPIAALGGHGDTTKLGIDKSDVFASSFCDGVESCRRAVRVQHKIGADVIKMMSTGGFHDKTGTEQLFFFDEMEATVAAAHQLGLTVATHAYAGPAIDDAVRAGVDSVEHGMGATDDTLKEMKREGVYLVPTLSLIQSESREITGYARQYNAFERALKIGTPIAFGSDVGGIPHKYTAREFRYMVAAGMSPAAAIESATVNTADLFGLSDEIGTLEAGKLADLIAVREDPLKNIEVLETVEFVMKSGRIAKRDGVMADLFLP
jgi:imidazolonepropionase-like amidohydrolase